MQISFHFYDVKVAVTISAEFAESIGRKLREDFGYFEVPHPDLSAGLPFNLAFNITCERQLREAGRDPATTQQPYLFKTKLCYVYGWGRHRLCDYGEFGRVVSRETSGQRIFDIFCATEPAAYELCYIAMLSAIGEQLDILGYHRIHGVGLRFGSKNGILSLPSGKGKSSIAAFVLSAEMKQNQISIHSDEIPLLKHGNVHPFPIRIALLPEVAKAIGLTSHDTRPFERILFREKWLLPIPGDRVAKEGQLDFIAVGPCRYTWQARFQLFARLTVGLGVPQMREHMLRANAFPKLIRIFVSRLFEATRLILTIPIVPYVPDADIQKNAKKFLNLFAGS